MHQNLIEADLQLPMRKCITRLARKKLGIGARSPYARPQSSGVRRTSHEVQRLLTRAIIDGEGWKIERAILHGANIIHRDRQGCTPLMLAAQLGKLEACEKLLELGARLCSRNRLLQTPLMLAAERSHTSVVDLLISSTDYAGQRMDIESEDCEGKRALHYAALAGNVEITALLLAAGANLKVVDRFGNLPYNLIELGSSPDSELFALLRGSKSIEEVLSSMRSREVKNVVYKYQTPTGGGGMEENDRIDANNYFRSFIPSFILTSSLTIWATRPSESLFRHTLLQETLRDYVHQSLLPPAAQTQTFYLPTCADSES